MHVTEKLKHLSLNDQYWQCIMHFNIDDLKSLLEIPIPINEKIELYYLYRLFYTDLYIKNSFEIMDVIIKSQLYNYIDFDFLYEKINEFEPTITFKIKNMVRKNKIIKLIK